jgi:hypothetical protein
MLFWGAESVCGSSCRMSALQAQGKKRKKKRKKEEIDLWILLFLIVLRNEYYF